MSARMSGVEASPLRSMANFGVFGFDAARAKIGKNLARVLGGAKAEIIG